jgi:hypothetical protein
MRLGLGILPVAVAGFCASVYVTAETGAPPAPRTRSTSQAPSASQGAPTPTTTTTTTTQAASEAPAQVDYARDIFPILQQTCFECHGPKKGRGQLRLHTRALTMKGGVSGPVVVPGKSIDSLLVQRLLGPDGTVPHEDQMPLERDPLSPQQLALIRTWIDQGARWPDPSTPSAPAPTATTATNTAARTAGATGADAPQTNALGTGASTAGTAAAGTAATGTGATGAGAMGASAASAPAEPNTAEDEPAPHWAYVKPTKPTVPDVSQPQWAKNPIDHFILARLDREQLTPAPPAAKHTWLRRVSLDLTGLPPTTEELDTFVKDERPDARERVVDRLLASPHYGERWARPWLDLARYADTNGYEKDNRRSIWPYRDWVIDALNADMPFDRFTIEQIAGDMLPDATPAQRVASGFHRNAMTNEEGGVDPEESLYEVLVDRVNTTATVWLGSTVACAQCHNHKYDPFTQKDYYRLLAFFQPTSYTSRTAGDGTRYSEASLDLASADQEQRRAALDQRIKTLEATLKAPTPALTAAQAAWETSLRNAPAAWTPLMPSHVEATGGVTLTAQADGSVVASGPNAEQTVYTITANIASIANTALANITGVRLEALPDERLPKGGPGRDPYGHFRLTGIEVDLTPAQAHGPAQAPAHRPAAAPAHDPAPGAAQAVTFDAIKVDDFVYRIEPEALLSRTAHAYARKGGAWTVDAMKDDTRLPRQAVLIPEKPFAAAAGSRLTIRLKHLDGTLGQGLGRFRLSVTTSANPARVVEVPARLRHVLAIPAAKRTEKQRNDLADYFRTTTPLLEGTRKELKAARKALADLAIPTTLVMQERETFERPSTYLRERGSFTAKGAITYAGVPASLHAWPESAPINRLGLAQWLVDPSNPLVARVAVNRLWEQVFGRGLVETSEDFGTQGAPPSHPELLDWLATEFVDRKWSQKALLRLIVTSSTYAQDAHVSAALLERDPYNRLLARGSRFRLEAETIRDLTLSASGLLNPALRGPSVFPPQPDGIWNIPYNTDKWTTSTGPDRYRRSLYTFLRRTSPYPTQMTFDATSREYCTVRRVRTNTPLQALALLNDDAFFEAAQALARRLLTDRAAGTSPESRAAFGFRLVTARQPDATELARLLQLYTTELAHYRAHPDDAKAVTTVKGSDDTGTNANSDALASSGPRATDSSADVAEQAAWTIVANVLFNLDETVTKE